MNAAYRPNIGAAMVAIHKAITRGLIVSGERSDTYLEAGFPDEATGIGFFTYVRTLCQVINAHHVAEDRVIFPYLKAKGLEAPYDKLSADHKEMDEVLREIGTIVDSPTARSRRKASLTALDTALTEMTKIWGPHIKIEQEKLYDVKKSEAVMSDEEQTKLIGDASAVSQQQADPGLLLPFVLYNLRPADRAIMIRALPPAVINEMIPVVWKSKWEPMKPFLLADI